MAQKVRLELQAPSPGFVRKCVSCRNDIINTEFYKDISCDDDLCTKCASWFIDNGYAKVQ